MHFSDKNLPRYIRKKGDKYMYQISFNGSRMQHTYDTWEQACVGRNERANELIEKHPEERWKLEQYIGNKEGLKRTSSEELPH